MWAVAFLFESCGNALWSDSLISVQSRFRGYSRYPVIISSTLFWSLLWSCCGTILTAFCALLAPDRFSSPIMALGLVLIAQRLHMQIRRVFYIYSLPKFAVLISATYFIVLIGGAYFQFYGGTVTGAVMLWAGASLSASLVGFALGVHPLAWPDVRTFFWTGKSLWRVGRWLMSASVAYWLGNHGLVAITAAWLTVEEAGILRAYQNLFTPLIQIIAALFVALLPYVAARIRFAGFSTIPRSSLIGALVFGGASVCYCSALYAAAPIAVPILYAKPSLMEFSWLLVPLAAVTIADAIRQGLSFGPVASGRTQVVFWGRMVGVFVLLGTVFFLASTKGVLGVAWAMAASSFCVTLTFLLGVLRLRSKT